jgi:hypothetical protein
MARKSSKPNKSNQPPSTTDLGLSELRVRLNFLEKENQKLLKQIEKNRTELSNLTSGIRELSIQIAQRSAPMIEKFKELDRQIHELFNEILNGRKLGKQSRKSIESVYYHLQMDGLISFKAQPEVDFESDDSDQEPDWDYQEQRSQPEFEKGFGKPDREDLKKIRQLFLRLAEIFHPDKVTDEADKEYNTEVMKEINQAYQSGDLAKLLAIEKQQELGEIINRHSADDLTRQCARVEAENEFLKSQSESLKQELRMTKNTEQGAMALQYKKTTKSGHDPIGEALEELEAQVKITTELYKFVVDFRDRRMTIKDFLKGPTSLVQQQMSEEELLIELLSGVSKRYRDS